jgi:hypothetical protein
MIDAMLTDDEKLAFSGYGCVNQYIVVVSM